MIPGRGMIDRIDKGRDLLLEQEVDVANGHFATGGTAGPTVADLVEDLGEVLAVISEADELSARVHEVVVHDPRHAVQVRAEDMVLAVGVDPAGAGFADLCRRYADAGASALVVKGPGPESWVDAPKLSVLQVPDAMDWGQLLTLLRTALAASGGAFRVGGQPFDVENLFALCNVLASRCGTPVVLHDPQWRLLAYSGSDDDLDDARKATILGRQAPQQWLMKFRDDGSLARILSGEVVHLGGDRHPGLAPRSAMAILAGSEVLGTMWLLHRESTDLAGLEAAMRETANVAALQLVRSRISSSAAARARGEVFATLLSGSTATPALAERLGIPLTAPLLLAGFRPLRTDELGRAVAVERVVARLRTFCDAYRLRSRQAVLDDTAYVLLHLVSDEAHAAAVRVIRDLHGQLTRPGERLHSAIGRLVGGLAELPRTQTDVRILLDLQGDGRLTSNGPADVMDHGVMIEYEHVRRVLSRDPDVVPPSLRRLLEDAESYPGWVETLRAFFDLGGDAHAAGKALGVHPNTVRYRLRRVRDLFGVDLDDPIQRFVVEMHLRLFT